jgi:hypothetical protein
MFPPAIWNVHDATVNGDARTNNMREGWNNKYSTEQSEVVVVVVERHQAKLLYLSP